MRYVFLLITFLFSCKRNEETRKTFNNKVVAFKNLENNTNSNNLKESLVDKVSHLFKSKNISISHSCSFFCQKKESKMWYFTEKNKVFFDSTIIMDRQIKFSKGNPEDTKYYIRTWLFNDSKNLEFIKRELSKPFNGVEFTFKSPHIVIQEKDSLHIFYVYTKSDENKLLDIYKKLSIP